MKPVKSLSFLLLLFTVSQITESCRFGRPITAFPGEHYQGIDSLSNTSFAKTSFYYLCLRNGISIGAGNSRKAYNVSGKLAFTSVFKRTHAWVMDGHNRYYFKQITYDSSGNKQKAYYRISQNRGVGGSTIFEDSVMLIKTKAPAVK